MRDARQSWDASEHGMFSSPLQLPGNIRLDKLEVGFGSKNQPQNVKSDISFFNESGSVDSLTASINGIIHYRGERIYHASQYGDAFTVTFTDRSGRVHSETIAMQQPLGLEKAGYSPDFRVAGSPCQYEAKYFADADKKSMRSGNALLSIRMLDKGREVARTALTIGQTGVLGEYQVRLIKVKKWAKIIFVDIKGMSVIFTGFAIIMLGGIIHYMTPPRELVGIMQPDGLYRVYWKAAAFKGFYHDERDEIVRELNRENIV
jgi:cytochrome c biogenesis protein ResB